MCVCLCAFLSLSLSFLFQDEHGQLGRPETECDSSTFPLQLKTPKNHTVRDVISGHSSWHSVLICEKVS
eukprot:m.114233 g.114233  ORF g.114233 m.114233 type:complete len:69 (-) comp22918_c0_seq7:58-264(-)